MYFKLSRYQENELLNYPETGMGYQIVEATKAGKYKLEKFLILNSEIVIEMNGFEGHIIRLVIYEGIDAIKAKAEMITLNVVSVFSEKQYRNLVSEPETDNEKGALDNPVENSNGEEVFVRLSAFEDDKRIDKTNKCLLPGSYTTMMDDYLICKTTKNDPVERHALPCNDEIRFAFHIQPLRTDTLQRGTVQPANDRRGGGKEAFFAMGTSLGTFIKQTPY